MFEPRNVIAHRPRGRRRGGNRAPLVSVHASSRLEPTADDTPW